MTPAVERLRRRVHFPGCLIIPPAPTSAADTVITVREEARLISSGFIFNRIFARRAKGRRVFSAADYYAILWLILIGSNVSHKCV